LTPERKIRDLCALVAFAPNSPEFDVALSQLRTILRELFTEAEPQTIFWIANKSKT
jgi:hypothetical protein